MNQRLRWWVLPGAMIVLLRVVTLGEADPAADVAVVDASNTGARTTVREAASRRSADEPVEIDFARAFVANLATTYAGERGTMRLWRRLPQGREATPWLTFRARVRDDGTLPIAGLAAGRYDVELRLDDALLVAENVTAPGTFVLQALTAQPPR